MMFYSFRLKEAIWDLRLIDSEENLSLNDQYRQDLLDLYDREIPKYVKRYEELRYSEDVPGNMNFIKRNTSWRLKEAINDLDNVK